MPAQHMCLILSLSAAVLKVNEEGDVLFHFFLVSSLEAVGTIRAGREAESHKSSHYEIKSILFTIMVFLRISLH